MKTRSNRGTKAPPTLFPVCPYVRQSVHRHQRLELQKLASQFLWRYATETMAPVLCAAFHRHRGERHLLQVTGENDVQEMAREHASRISFLNQRASLHHAQQEAAGRRRTRHSLSSIGVASRPEARCCGLATAGVFEKRFSAAREVCKESAALEKHATRDRISAQIVVRQRSNRLPLPPRDRGLHV